ncbi:Gfo/Idh/MocA family protein [Oligosphaera ethanolica]|uniref:Dehydrogenase n=1 Tax=Oligosphaera ethanolica TaxID=760260 RepID=A0AAE4AMF6_9BACT|nr:Gfo/Idh/MocA family oxidoreductase [Oligosphaera ethanolica]MDQ0288385.1 putative dehydrogenase [Oligosphaera ethanolica]
MAKSAKKVRVGFIGCGGIANFHFAHYDNNKIPDAQITAVCDLLDDRVQKAATRFGATPYKDYKEMLSKEKLDAVYVCVEPCAHKGMELMAIEKGCHLFVEKPVALCMDYAREVEKGLKAKKLINGAGFQDRYLDFVPMMKNWVAQQKVGFFNAYWVGGMPGVWWWRRRDTSGGQAVEQTIHTFDMCRLLFGEVVAVQAFGRRGIITDVENYDTEDASAVNLKFENGIIGTVYSGCFVRGGGGKNGIDCFTMNGRMEYTERAGVVITEPTRTINAKTGNDYGQEEDNVFIEAILSNDQSIILSPYSEAVKNLEVTLAANESMDNGGKVVVLKDTPACGCCCDSKKKATSKKCKK